MSGQDRPEPVDLTKQEALDLIVLRDQVEEAYNVYLEAQKSFEGRFNEIFNKYGVSSDTHGWLPSTGSLLPIKVKDEQITTSTN